VFQAAFCRPPRSARELPDAQLIFGQLEARLTETDRIILGGLVGTVWAAAPRVDPWLSGRCAMNLALDLPSGGLGFPPRLHPVARP